MPNPKYQNLTVDQAIQLANNQMAVIEQKWALVHDENDSLSRYAEERNVVTLDRAVALKGITVLKDLTEAHYSRPRPGFFDRLLGRPNALEYAKERDAIDRIAKSLLEKDKTAQAQFDSGIKIKDLSTDRDYLKANSAAVDNALKEAYRTIEKHMNKDHNMRTPGEQTILEFLSTMDREVSKQTVEAKSEPVVQQKPAAEAVPEVREEPIVVEEASQATHIPSLDYWKNVTAENDINKERLSDKDRAEKRTGDIRACQTLDELFRKATVDITKLSEEEKESLQFFEEHANEAEAAFKRKRNEKITTMEESRWKNVTDPNEIAKRRQAAAALRLEYYEDKLGETRDNPLFKQGKLIALYSQATPEVLERAVELIRAEQVKYDRTSRAGRFFSYLNPFSNKYRDQRNAIEAMKQQVADRIKCTRADLDKLVAGKVTEIPYENSRTSAAAAFNEVLRAEEEYQQRRQEELAERFDNDRVEIEVDLATDFSKEDMKFYEMQQDIYKDIPLADIQNEYNAVTAERRKQEDELGQMLKDHSAEMLEKLKADRDEHEKALEALKEPYARYQAFSSQIDALSAQMREQENTLKYVKNFGIRLGAEGEQDFIKMCENAVKYCDENQASPVNGAAWAVNNDFINGRNLAHYETVPEKDVEKFLEDFEAIQTHVKEYIAATIAIRETPKKIDDIKAQRSALKREKEAYEEEEKINNIYRKNYYKDQTGKVVSKIGWKTSESATVLDYSFETHIPGYAQKEEAVKFLVNKEDHLKKFIGMRKALGDEPVEQQKQPEEKRALTREEQTIFDKLEMNYSEVPVSDLDKMLKSMEKEITEKKAVLNELKAQKVDALTEKIAKDKALHEEKLERISNTISEHTALEARKKELLTQIPDTLLKADHLQSFVTNAAFDRKGTRFHQICDKALRLGEQKKMSAKELAEEVMKSEKVTGDELKNFTEHFNEIQTALEKYIDLSNTVADMRKEKAEIDEKLNAIDIEEKKELFEKETKIVNYLKTATVSKAETIGKPMIVADRKIDYTIAGNFSDVAKKQDELESLVNNTYELSVYCQIRGANTRAVDVEDFMREEFPANEQEKLKFAVSGDEKQVTEAFEAEGGQQAVSNDTPSLNH